MVTANFKMFKTVQSEVAKVVETQGTVERQLELIETHQQEVYWCAICWLFDTDYLLEESQSTQQQKPIATIKVFSYLSHHLRFSKALST